MITGVPYAELYRMAEQAYHCWDELEVNKACQDAAWKYEESYNIVRNKVYALLRKEFDNA